MTPYIYNALVFAAAAIAAMQVSAASISNSAFRVETALDGSATVTEMATGASASFAPKFRLSYSAASPGWQMYDGSVKATEYSVAGFYPMLWKSDPDFFNAPGSHVSVSATGTTLQADTIVWTFPPTNGMMLVARITAPAGDGEPLLSFELTAGPSGYYTAGYVGAPEFSTNAVDWIWQPLFWTDKRFPSTSFLTPEAQCTLPAVLSGYNNQTIGLAVDPGSVYSAFDDTSKRVLDTTSGMAGNFGVALRNEAGKVQPMVFAPIYGQSSLPAGAKISLSMRLVARQGQWYESYKNLATELYSFSNYRSNATCSLNTTLDNLQDYMQGPYGHWLPRYKDWDYVNDKPGWGRQQSAADAISLALLKDDYALFTNIARPTLEYMLSRSSALFPLSETNEPAPSTSTMGGWIGETYGYGGTDMAATYLLTGKRSTVIYTKLQPTLRTTALTGASNLPLMRDAIGDLLSNYRLTGNRTYLNEAIKTATNYLALRFGSRPSGRADAEGGFFTQLGSAWQLLNEMYEETGDTAYRDAFVQSLREFTAFTFLSPAGPPGNVSVSNYMSGALESVPAWRVDPRGLMREASATMHSHVGIHMPPFASYMLRAAYFAQDPFLEAVARSAVLGRYESYPGYAYRRRLTHSFSLKAWPLQDYSVIRNYITMHFNHPLPMTMYLLEFLVEEAGGRSAGQIRFPGSYTWTGAYFNHRVYGAAPGTFYGDTNVFLWMPRSLTTNSSIQIDYISGYGNGNFYVALLNQSSNSITTQLGIDSGKVSLAGNRTMRVYQNNAPQPTASIENGVANVTVLPMGITALVISNAPVTTSLQALCYESNPAPLPVSAYQDRTGTPVGDVCGQLLSFGSKLTSAFVAISADTNTIRSATLRFETNGTWSSIPKMEFPFEFTIPLPDNTTSVRFYVEGRTPTGQIVSNSAVQLGCQLTIRSPQGPGSAESQALYTFNQYVTASAPAAVDSGATRYVCTGWTMAGNSPQAGTSKTVTFALTNDATLEWQWDSIPLPEIGNVVATRVTAREAWLNATLISTGRAPASVFFYWGPTDGGTNASAWPFSANLGPKTAGAVSNLITGLDPQTHYFFRAAVTNSDAAAWSAESCSFVTTGTNAWDGQPPTYRMKLAFTNYNRGETLTNFPALVVLGTHVPGFSYGQFLSAAGHDLRFWDGTPPRKLNYEIGTWNTNGNSFVWVQVPELSKSTSVYATWGDPDNSEPYVSLQDGATWSNGYEAVWHLGETPGGANVISDSSPRARHGIAHNLAAMDQVPGPAGGSLKFNGSTTYISLNSELLLAENSGFTISAWIRPEGTTAYPGITAPSTSPGYNNSLRLFGSTPRFNIAGNGKLFSSTVSKDGATWTWLCVTRAAGAPGNFALYANGANDTGTATATTAPFPFAYLGRGMETNDPSRNWNGALAEVRASSVERSSNWIWAEYQTVADPAFISYGSVERIVPLLLQIAVVGTNLVFSWPSRETEQYDLEHSGALDAPFSALISGISATPPITQVTNPISGGTTFYRIKAN